MCNSIKDGKNFRCEIHYELYYVLIKSGRENGIYGNIYPFYKKAISL